MAKAYVRNQNVIVKAPVISLKLTLPEAAEVRAVLEAAEPTATITEVIGALTAPSGDDE